jgi:protein O-GlcNAc transferase
LTCFHTYSRGEKKPDSFCVGRGATLDSESGKFRLGCKLRDIEPQETSRGIIPFQEIKSYWYDTGPRQIFSAAIDLISKPIGSDDDVETEIGAKSQHAALLEDELSLEPPRKFLLLKREGEGNLWHCMMEIFSALMTFDVLSMSRDPLRKGEPLFRMPEDAANTQVVVVDKRPDGPYFDLWTLFAKGKPVRLNELLASPAAVKTVRQADIIIPLAGAGNPLWQDEWASTPCTSAPTLSTFSRRVLSFYNVVDPAPRTSKDPIMVTFIDRRHRRLENQDALFAELGRRHPRVTIRMIDFAAIPLAEQLSVVRDTDLLVGVHGAGLTHIMFMREGLGTVVEIQPASLDQYGYRNLAIKRGLNYFRVHAEAVTENTKAASTVNSRSMKQRRGDWHWEDVWIEEGRFLDIMDAAIKSMYSKGPWNYDVN